MGEIRVSQPLKKLAINKNTVVNKETDINDKY